MRNLILGSSFKICGENRNLVKIGHLTWRPKYVLLLLGTLKRQKLLSSRDTLRGYWDSGVAKYYVVEAGRNVMAHAQKTDFFFWRNGRVHLNRRGRQFSRLLAAEVCAISDSNAGYTMFRGSVKGTGYPLHSPVSHSLSLPCVTVCHHISSGVYVLCQSCYKKCYAYDS